MLRLVATCDGSGPEVRKGSNKLAFTSNLPPGAGLSYSVKHGADFAVQRSHFHSIPALDGRPAQRQKGREANNSRCQRCCSTSITQLLQLTSRSGAHCPLAWSSAPCISPSQFSDGQTAGLYARTSHPPRETRCYLMGFKNLGRQQKEKMLSAMTHRTAAFTFGALTFATAGIAHGGGAHSA